MNKVHIKKLYNGEYEVTSEGEVFSYLRGKRKQIQGRIAKSSPYPRVQLYLNGKTKEHLIHRLVAENFIPNPNELRTVNHKNGIKTDNRVENLEWCSHSENSIHARDNKLREYKINMEIAQEIRRVKSELKISQKNIAQMFGIDQTQVANIINNKQWKE